LRQQRVFVAGRDEAMADQDSRNGEPFQCSPQMKIGAFEHG
jgi:hypothetical protein